MKNIDGLSIYLVCSLNVNSVQKTRCDARESREWGSDRLLSLEAWDQDTWENVWWVPDISPMLESSSSFLNSLAWFPFGYANKKQRQAEAEGIERRIDVGVAGRKQELFGLAGTQMMYYYAWLSVYIVASPNCGIIGVYPSFYEKLWTVIHSSGYMIKLKTITPCFWCHLSPDSVHVCEPHTHTIRGSMLYWHVDFTSYNLL